MPFDGQDFTPRSRYGVQGPPGRIVAEVLRHWFSFGAERGRVTHAAQPIGQPNRLGTLQILTVARALVSEKKYWAQGRYETVGGRRCAVGALCVAAEILGCGSSEDAGRHLLSVARERGYLEVEAMNDNSSHAEILSAFDNAIVHATHCLLAHS